MKPYYSDEYVTLYHGDCLNVMADMPSESVGIICTDPPYSSGARQSAQLRGRGSMRRESGEHGRDRWFASDNLSAHGFAMLVRLFATEALRVTERDGHLLCWIDWRQLPVVQGSLEAAGWSARALLTWDKKHYGMGNGFRQQSEHVVHASKGIGDNFLRHDIGTVYREARPDASIDHPTVKPSALIELWLSALPGDVLDPFMGSGSTLVAAKSLGRKSIGVEIEERYCEIAARRLSQGVLDFGGAA